LPFLGILVPQKVVCWYNCKVYLGKFLISNCCYFNIQTMKLAKCTLISTVFIFFTLLAKSQATSGFSGTGGNYNIIFERVFWRVNPDTAAGNYIKGVVDFKFKTVANNVTAISFDLRSTYTINYIKFRGVNLPTANYSNTANKVMVTLGTTLGINTIDSLTISYQGVPPAASGAAQGFQTVTNAYGYKYASSLSESYEDRDWWPCKADMQDKIDSMEINVSVPWNGADTFWVATNGHLYDSTIAGGTRVFKTKVSYPIASYLVSLSVARYKRLYSSVTLPSGFNLKGHFYFFTGRSATDLQARSADIKVQNDLVYAFSEKFGDYPFKNEKYGYYEGIEGAGGMEHQGFYGMASGSIGSQATLAHELGHQWFGDKVTFKTWNDLWLAEGFARYSEALAAELVPATSLSFASELSAARTSARGITTTTVRLPSITSSNTIWSNNNIKAIYDKGCMVVSMLRTLCGDAKFYTALQMYLDVSAPYGSANTDTLKNVFSRVLNYDMTAFFDAYVYKYGHATTNVRWGNPSGNWLAIMPGVQTKSASSNVTYFPDVISVRVQGASAGQDTTIVFLNVNGDSLIKAGNGFGLRVAGGPLYYKLSFKPTTVTIDPQLRSLNTAGTATFESTLANDVINFTGNNIGTTNVLNLVAEQNSTKNFVVERSIGEPTSFLPIGNMVAKNTNTTQNLFSFYDYAVANTIIYYRIKYSNAAGQISYSNTIALTKNTATKDNKIVVIHTEQQNQLMLQVLSNSLTTQPMQLTIFGTDGKLYQSVTTNLQLGLNILKINTLTSGTYIATIKNQNTVLQTITFVK
jgi:hypothetical protein